MDGFCVVSFPNPQNKQLQSHLSRTKKFVYHLDPSCSRKQAICLIVINCKYDPDHSTPAINQTTIVSRHSQQCHIDCRTVMKIARQCCIAAAATILYCVIFSPPSSSNSQYHTNKFYSWCQSDLAGYKRAAVGKPELPSWVGNECLNWGQHNTRNYNNQCTQATKIHSR
jgi:hypothetical protein